MSWFQLDPQSIVTRVRASGDKTGVPSLAVFLRRGIVGFMLVSVAGFLPWALAGRWFHRTMGEGGLYAVCAIVFILLSGPLLHRLIIGPGSLSRFYKLFSIAFAGYSVAWTVGWMMVGGHAGSMAGLLAGSIVMGGIFALAFDAPRTAVKIIAALFVLNAIGYFVGGWVAGMTKGTVAKLLWGVCYGVGLGTGLGLAFYYCQSVARDLLARKD